MINEVPEFYAGRALADEANAEEPALEDSLAWGHTLDSLPQEGPVQVAGIGSGLARILGRGITGATTRVAPAAAQLDRKMMEEVLRGAAKERTAGAKARRVDLEAVRQGGTPPVPIAEGAPSPRAVRGTSGEVNLERAHPGAPAQDYERLMELAGNDPGQILRMVRSADEMGDILDVIGERLHEAPRTHASIRDRGFDYDQAAQALTQEGLANDRQLFALRTMVATLGEKAAGIARKIYQGDHSPETLLSYEKVGEQLIAFTSFTKGQTREIARALSQQNMIADVLSGDDLRAFDMAIKASAGGDPQAIINSAKALWQNLAKGVPPGEAFERAMKHRTWFEAALEWWKANSLSAPATHIANAASAPLVITMETLSRGAGAIVGEARHALHIGSPEYYSTAEFAEAFMGGMTGVTQSLKLFWHTLLTGESALGAYGGKEVGTGAIAEKVGPMAERAGAAVGMSPELSQNLLSAAATPAFRVMLATDDAMMLPAVMAQLAGLAARDGVMGRLTGDALARHVDRLIANPTYEMQQSALELGRKVVMQASADDPMDAGAFTMMGELMHRLVQKLPILQFQFPWIKTPARIMDYAMESSVLAAVSPQIWRRLAAGGAEADIAAGKIIMGSAVTAAAYPLIESMTLTGAGPENPEQLAALEALGWKPYSVRVGDTYISYKNWADPIVGLIAGMATGIERARFARQDTDVAREVMTAISSMGGYMLETSYMEGFKRLVDAAEDKSGRLLLGLMTSAASGFVPYSGATAAVARATDDMERARSKVKTPGFGGEGYITDMWNMVKEDLSMRMPGYRDHQRPARYWDGRVKVPEGGQLVSTLTPFKMGELKKDPASLALVTYGVMIRTPPSTLELSPLIKLELLDFDSGAGVIYDRYLTEVGVARREAVELMIDTYDYKSSSSDWRALMLDKAIAYGTAAGRGKFLAETLFPLIEKGGIGVEKSAIAAGLSMEDFLGAVLEQRGPVRAIVPKSRQKIPVTPELRFQ